MSGDLVFKCYYRKSLNMSPGKLAAQIGHVVSYLSLTCGERPCRIIVLEARDQRFHSLKEKSEYIQVDAGLTEVGEGVETALGWVEGDNHNDDE